MATEKKITSRIQQKHDVAANWAKATNFIPKKGEIIIYDAEYNASGEETQAVRFKIGDGSKTVNNLPFAVIDYGSDIETLEQEVANNSTAIGKIQGAFETNGTTVKKATSAGTADKVANGLTIANATFDGSKPLTIGTSGKHIEIMGGSVGSPTHVSIGLAFGNLMPSSYNKVTIDGYGFVVDGENVDYAKKTDIPPKVTESTVSGWGFTKNEGTVTSVAVKMNGSTKGTITSSGTIDLGTVITDISGKLDKTTYEVNKTIEFGSSGVLYVGKFKVCDTNVTCEITSTTSVTYSGKLVIATQNYVIMQMTVYGDAADTVAPNFFIKPSTTSDPYIEIYFKPASWSKNVVHIYGSAIKAEPTNVCTNVSAVPSTATSKPTNALNGKANLLDGNIFNGTQEIQIDSTTAGTEQFIVHDAADGLELINATATSGLALPNGFTTSGAIDCQQGASVGDFNGFLALDYSNIDHPVLSITDGAVVDLDGDKGTEGQVFTSNGDVAAPYWSTPAIKSASLSGTTLTLILP